MAERATKTHLKFQVYMKLLNQICLFGIRDPIYRREREAPTQALRKLAGEKKSPNFNGVVKRQEQCYKI